MKREFTSKVAYEAAPLWLEGTAPVEQLVVDIPSIIMVRIPDESCWFVATHNEANIICDPDSLIGGILRTHAGLLPLAHISLN
jgi:hypothetical protein